jgi:acyl transferase domain-containing protein/NAD(P)-dependent dehydrogenase (short-subunit alcohol dehydrogenase family)/acyl-CoA thioesterase FadM
MFYAIPYRVLFHDTMAYGTQHFLTNFKFQCEAREHLLFRQLDLCTPDERRDFQDIVLLTLNAFSRNMNSVPVGGRVAIFLSLEDMAPSSGRFCFRVVGEQGQPVACGFQTVAALSKNTQQLVAFPRFLQGQHIMRERLSAPDFQTRVLSGDTASLFPEYVRQTGVRIARSFEDAPPGFVPSVKWETDHSSLWQSGLGGKVFLFPGTGSLAWPRLAAILASAGFRDLLAHVDAIVRSNLDYGVLALTACGSEDDFTRMLRKCSGMDQICNYLVSVHCATLLAERGERPDLVIGHSAGELSALAVAGAYGLREGLDVVCKRITALTPHRGSGGMLVISAHRRRVEALIGSLVTSNLHISVINHQDQVAVSGQADDLAQLRDLASHLRISHVLLPSEYPFHSKLLEPAVERFAGLLGGAALRTPTVPAYSPLERDFYGPARLADVVPFHFVRTLDYCDAIARAYELGIRTFVDCSTGATLKGIVERVLSAKGDVAVKPALDADLFSKLKRPATAVSSTQAPIADVKLAPADEQEAHGDVPLAIVGLGCVLPGARNPDELWNNVKNGIDSIVDLSAVSPRDAADFLSRGDIVVDKTYSLLSGVVDNTGGASLLDTNDQGSLAQRILKSAVLQATSHLGRSDDAKVQLIMGSTSDGYVDLDEVVLAAEIEQAAGHLPNSHDRNGLLAQALRRVFVRRPATALSLTATSVLNNVAREVLGPQATALAIDAACASSLYAIQLGMERLREHKTDMAICGGVYIAGPANWCLFAQFGGLSAKGPRPFDAAADGVVFCPGAAVVALKRLPDALRDKDPIAAVIRGCGTSSDGKGASVTEPKKEGQVLALRRAYKAGQINIETVQYVEAHATATRVGDAVEFAALNEVFKEQQGEIALGSIKSIIGHTGWAAGAASVIKVCRAMQHKTIPPQANFSTPSPDIDLKASRFVIPSTGLPWPRQETPRRAGVNGFGFGGTNSHLILEEYDPDYHSPWREARGTTGTTLGDDTVVLGVGVVRPDDGGMSFDPRILKLPQRRRVLPDVLDSMDRSQIAAIMAVDQALAYLGSRWVEWRDDIGVIFGFEGKTASSMQIAGRLYLDRIKRRLSQALSELGASGDEQQAIVSRLARAVSEKTPPSGPYTLPGLMPNLIAGRVSNLFDLRGPNFIVDAAGASLMEAIRIASSQLRRGASKIILAGGISANASPAAQLTTSERWRRGRALGESALVLLLARSDFAREASLQPLATLSTNPDANTRAEEIHIGGERYLMGAEGAPEIEAALSKARGKIAAVVSWRMPNGVLDRIQFSAPPQLAAAIQQPEDSLDARGITAEHEIDYCAIEFEPSPAPMPAKRINLRHSKVLLICDQPHVLDPLEGLRWIHVSPSGLRIPDAHPVDLSSEPEFLKSCKGLPLADIDTVIALKDLAGMPLEMPSGPVQFYSSFDLSVALAKLLYPQIKQGKTRFVAMCCSAWGDRALHPVTGLFGGMVKSLARELPNSRCTAIYTDAPMGSAALEQLHAELDGAAPDDAREVAYRDGTRRVAKLVRILPSEETDGFALSDKSVILATGGGRGITAKMIEAMLERYRCNIAILGRVDPNDLPGSLRGVDEQAFDALERTFYQTGLRDNPDIGIKALKQQFEYLRACREVQSNLDLFRSFGARVEYFSVDITNADAVDAAMSSIRRKLGRLDLVIHGAGIQDSRPFDRKDLVDFRRVVSTKVDGLANVRRACQRHFARSQIHYHLVTSTFSVLGNDGQADYGAANELLNRTAQWRSSNGEPWSALAWLGWASVGMTRGGEYKKLGERRGLRAVRPDEGKTLFADFIASNRLKPVAVLMSAGESKYYNVPVIPAEVVRRSKTKLNGGLRRITGGQPRDDEWKISLTTHQSLTDHRVTGRPTVPGVFAIDFAVRSAQTQGSDFQSIAVSDARFERFIGVRGDQDTELKAKTQLIKENGEESEYRVELRSDFVHSTGIVLNRNVLHYACNVHLVKRRDVGAELRQFVEPARFTSVPDPYLDSDSPVSLRGVFRCLDDIRISDGMRCASFRNIEGKLPPELLNSSIPCLLLDALGRLSSLTLDSNGCMPIVVPVHGSRIWIAAGASDRSLLGTTVMLRAGAPRVDGEMMFMSYGDATTPDGHVILVLQDFVCKIMGAVKVEPPFLKTGAMR